MANRQASTDSGFLYIRKNEKYEEGSKQPVLKGFISVSKEFLQTLLAEEEDEFGCVKLDAALWKDDAKSGVLKGKVTVAWKPEKGKSYTKKAQPRNNTPKGDDVY